MLTLKEAKKIPFDQLDQETQEYFYQTFKQYVLRKEISENNKELSKIFSKRCKSHNPRDYASYFSDFNSYFVGYNLIRLLNYDEVNSRYIKEMSDEQFNEYLKRNGGSFERKLAIVSFSRRPNEKIVNRLDFPAMQAYLDMQKHFITLEQDNPNLRFAKLLSAAAKMAKINFEKTNGYKFNQSKVSSTSTDLLAQAKKFAPVWKKLLEHYKTKLPEIGREKASTFVLENFTFNAQDKQDIEKALTDANFNATTEIETMRNIMTEQVEEQPDFYDPADYDEFFSKTYYESTLNEHVFKVISEVFDIYLSDPIFETQPNKTKFQ